MKRHRWPRRIRRWAVITLLLAVTAAVLGGAWFFWVARLALPKLDGSLRVAGLGAPVDVLRDSHGVPTVRAASLDDLFFAQGYVTAQDRLWQMDMTRRFAAGELAEVLGAKYVELDIAQRALGLRPVAEAAAARTNGPARQYLEAYARGVNAYIAAHPHSLPLEFRVLGYSPRPWSPADSLLIGAMMSAMLNENSHFHELSRERITARLGPKLAADLFPTGSGHDILPDGEPPFSTEAPAAQPESPNEGEEEHELRTNYPKMAGGNPSADVSALLGRRGRTLLAGSNNWVLSGAHTASGRPLLANDMHLPHRIPNTWYEVHLVSGDFDVAGVSLPGVPFVLVGHNRRIAWGFTNLGPDVQDLYVETFNEQGEYLTPSGWRKPEVRHEVIRVKRGRDRTLDVRVTRHGPIITPALKHESRQLALRWTLYDIASLPGTPGTLDSVPAAGAAAFALFELNRAGNWEEFRRALSRFTSPGQNVVYADVDGHIGYQATGLIPIRAAGNGSVPVSGSDDAHEWIGYIPFDALPTVFDPPSGIIATANSRVTPDGYPYLITTEWASAYRSERIHHLLRAGARTADGSGDTHGKFTAADMLAVQNDIQSDFDRFLAERFVYAIDRTPKASPRAREAAELLRQWNGKMGMDSAAAAIERHARGELYETLLRAKLGEDFKVYAWMNSATWLEGVVLHQPQVWLPPGFDNYEALLAAVLERVVSSPKAPAKLADWRYGQDFPVEISHPIFGKIPILKRWAGPGRKPQSGSGNTVKQVGRGFGPSQRMTVDFADFDASTLNLVNGQSGNLFSPHFNDQWTTWYTGTSFRLPFSAAAVDSAAQHRLRLEPDK